MNRLRIIRFSAFMGSRCRQIGLDAIEYAINTNPSSLGERAQSRLGNEVALAFFGPTPLWAAIIRCKTRDTGQSCRRPCHTSAVWMGISAAFADYLFLRHLRAIYSMQLADKTFQ